jgi:hypothetical protein
VGSNLLEVTQVSPGPLGVGQKTLCVALTLGILMLAALAQGAAADPIKAKTTSASPADCGGQTVQFVLNGNGDFTPAHVVGSTTVYVVQSFNVTFEFTPTGARPCRRWPPGPRGTCMGSW